LPALGWKATKPAGRSSGKRGQARTYEPSSAGKTDLATSCFQEDLYTLTLYFQD